MAVPAKSVVGLFVLLQVLWPGNSVTTIQWYRTAQGTDDRLTRQANISFGSDFTSDATITVNRYVEGGLAVMLRARSVSRCCAGT